MSIAGRSYGRVYRTRDREDLHAFLLKAVEQSGGTVLYASEPDRAPIYLGVQAGDERLGLVCYPFRCNPPPIANRPPDEHRLQIRLGGEQTWDDPHPIWQDIAGVDATLVLGIHPEVETFIGLDPELYDPLPMGISVEFKEAHVRAAQQAEWHVWERANIVGSRRQTPRALRQRWAAAAVETVVAFAPHRLLDFARFERKATALGLDQPLRFVAAIDAKGSPPGPLGLHPLEEEFELSSLEVLDIISRRMRLRVATKGGVAEHHLARHLAADPDVEAFIGLDEDGQPDFDVRLRSHGSLRIECKNIKQPGPSGHMQVEVQKTRNSKNDPSSRFYRANHFDVVAACIYPVTRRWEFRFKATTKMARHERYPDCLAVMHGIDDSWAATLSGAVATST